MPPRHKTPEEIEKTRRKILNSTLEIIAKEGYASLTMRKIAKCIGMSATSIYNYFHNKDEVYLAVHTEGYKLLYKETYNANQLGKNPKESLENVIRAFVNFGLNKTYYYELMFSSHTPKYFNYIGQPYEEIAYNYKAAALKWFDYFTECLSKCLYSHEKNHEANAKLITIRILAQLHGVINLHHNQILIEVHNNPCEVIDSAVEHVFNEIDSHNIY